MGCLWRVMRCYSRLLKVKIHVLHAPNRYLCPMVNRILGRVLQRILLMVGLGWAVCAQAGQVVVTSAADNGPGTLRQTIAQASDGDTLLLQVADTIFVDSQLTINRSVVVLGNGAVLHGRHQTRLATIPALVSVSFDSMAFVAGNAKASGAKDYTIGGGAIQCRGNLTLTGCLFSNNIAGFGGAIEFNGLNDKQYFGNITISNCSFINNVASQDTANLFYGYQSYGGAIFAAANESLFRNFKMQIINSTFSGNMAKEMGGAMYLLHSGNPVMDSVLIFNSTITQNEAMNGGGIESRPGTIVFIYNTVLANNTSKDVLQDFRGTLRAEGGNCLQFATPQVNYDIILTGSNILTASAKLSSAMELAPLVWGHIPLCGSPLIDAATAPGSPDIRGAARVGLPDIGAVERLSTDFAITTDASAGFHSLRAAMELACPHETLSLSALSTLIVLHEPLIADIPVTIAGRPGQMNQITTTDSIRLFEVNDSLAISNIALANANPQQYGGGAVLNRGTFVADQCMFIGNTALSGGAVAHYGDSLRLSNCYFEGNSATDLDGGAIDIRAIGSNPQVEIQFCTFVDNGSALRGGAIYTEAGTTALLANSLLISNSPDAIFPAGSLTVAYSALDDTTHFPGSWGQNRLIAAADVTQWATPRGLLWGPVAGSPALSAADPVVAARYPRDLVGNIRPLGDGPDMGALEVDLTGIEPITDLLLKIWPQPARDQIHLSFSRPVASITLVAADGRTVGHYQPTDLNLILSVNNLSEGLYYLQLTDTNGAVSAVSILVQ